MQNRTHKRKNKKQQTLKPKFGLITLGQIEPKFQTMPLGCEIQSGYARHRGARSHRVVQCKLVVFQGKILGEYVSLRAMRTRFLDKGYVSAAVLGLAVSSLQLVPEAKKVSVPKNTPELKNNNLRLNPSIAPSSDLSNSESDGQLHQMLLTDQYHQQSDSTPYQAWLASQWHKDFLHTTPVVTPSVYPISIPATQLIPTVDQSMASLTLPTDSPVDFNVVASPTPAALDMVNSFILSDEKMQRHEENSFGDQVDSLALEADQIFGKEYGSLTLKTGDAFSDKVDSLALEADDLFGKKKKSFVTELSIFSKPAVNSPSYPSSVIKQNPWAK